MDRKTHARFFGGWARVTAPGYPPVVTEAVLLITGFVSFSNTLYGAL